MWNPTDEPRDYARVVGKNVRLLRKRKGWSLEQLASALTELGYPIGFRVLSKIERMGEPGGERGGRPAGLNDFVWLATALDVTVERLLMPPEVVLNERFVELAKFAAQAFEEHIESMKKYIEATDDIIRVIDELATEEPDAADQFVQYLRQMYPEQYGVADAIENTIGSRRNPNIITLEDAQWWSDKSQWDQSLDMFISDLLEGRYGERPDDSERDAAKLREWVMRVIEGESNRG